ncbi:MAG TPA: DNA polymerase I, partial [Candidatus Obscuribacterales bacterium]
NELSQQEVLCLDLETSGLDQFDCDIVGYAFAWSDRIKLDENKRPAVAREHATIDGSVIQTAYIPVGHSGIIGGPQLDARTVADRLQPILANPSIGKIAQNAKFEMNVLSQQGLQFAPLCFDPMLASYILNPDEKHGLKEQVERLFGYQMLRITEVIGSGRKQTTMGFVPVDKAAVYAADDARMTYQLAAYYIPLLDDTQKNLLYDMEIPLTAVLARMEQNGVALDLPYLKAFSEELVCEIARLEGEVFELAGHPFNISSTQQLQRVLFEELNLKTQGKTAKKTGFSTDAAALESLKNEHPIIDKILEYRHLSKLRSTYVDGFPKLVNRRDGRLHGTFNQTVAATGRLSSTNPNLQNIPIKTDIGRRIRKAFVPGDKDSVLLSADYSQIELRLLAHMSGDETLIDAFEKNQDIHARTAGEIFDVPLDSVTSQMRGVGKTMNFALVYQQGDYRTGIDLGVSTQEAKQFRDKYFSRYPKVRELVNETLAKARETGYVTTLWGRRRYFRYLNDRNANIRGQDERAAFNAPLQGSAADLMKLAMIRLDKTLKEKNMKSRLILQVHDELVLEVPKEEIAAAREVVADAMQMDQPLKVPLVVDIGVGSNWMEAH